MACKQFSLKTMIHFLSDLIKWIELRGMVGFCYYEFGHIGQNRVYYMFKRAHLHSTYW